MLKMQLKIIRLNENESKKYLGFVKNVARGKEGVELLSLV